MRRGKRTSGEEVRIPILPTLEHYGAASVPDDGRWVRMLCPFHQESTPSASVNTDPDVQLFVCHGCEVKGNAAQIIMKVDGIDFQTAVECAAGYAGESAEPVLSQRRGRSALSGNQGSDSRSRRYRRVGRGNGRARGSRDEEG